MRAYPRYLMDVEIEVESLQWLYDLSPFADTKEYFVQNRNRSALAKAIFCAPYRLDTLWEEVY